MTDEKKRRRPPGAGSVSRMRDKFQVRVPLADGRRPTIATVPDRDEAEQILQAALEQLAASPAAAVGGLTLRAFGERWLDERELAGDVRDVRNERGRFLRHIADTDLGRLPLRAIMPRDVAGWARDLRTKAAAGTRGKGPLSKKTQNEVIRLLKAVLAAATSPEDPILDESPAVHLKPRRDLRTHDPWDYLRSAEIQRVRACDAIPDWHRWVILFAIGTGLRLGEQMNLHLADLVVDGPRPEVIVRYGSKGKPPKNGRIRRVPLFGIGLVAARRCLELLPSHCKSNPEGLVFPTPRGCRRQPGKHLHAARWNARKKKQVKVDLFKEYMAAAGIRRPIRWHDLRHTCASMLVSGEWGRAWTLAEVGEYLGHASRVSTERYAHLADTALHRAARETHQLAGGGCATAAIENVSTSQPLEIVGVGRQGLEPWTYGLKARSSTD